MIAPMDGPSEDLDTPLGVPPLVGLQHHGCSLARLISGLVGQRVGRRFPTRVWIAALGGVGVVEGGPRFRVRPTPHGPGERVRSAGAVVVRTRVKGNLS